MWCLFQSIMNPIMSQYWITVDPTNNIDSYQSCARGNSKRDAWFNVSFLMAWKTTWPHIASKWNLWASWRFSLLSSRCNETQKQKKQKNTSKNHLEEWTVLKTGKFAPAGQSRYQSTEGFFCVCLFFCFANEGEQYLFSAEDTQNKPKPSESRACACILPSPLSFAKTRDDFQSTIPKNTRFCDKLI